MTEGNIIAISYAKRALEQGSRENTRMKSYADVLSGYHVIVFTKKAEGFPDQQHSGSLNLYATNARTKIGMLWRAYLIGRSILKQSQTKQFVVSSQDPFETSLVGRALARFKNASHHVQIHGDVFNPASYTDSLLARVRAQYGVFVIKRAAAIRVVSERIKHSLVMLGADQARISVLPVQADLTELMQLGARRVYSEQSELNIIYIGRLAPEKQLDKLIAAVAVLKERGVACKLRIVGSGPRKSALESQVSDLGLNAQVSFVGWTEDIGAELEKADVFMLASAHEGWGMVLLEAAAAGLAIVSTDVGCVGECLVPEKSVLVAKTSSDFADALESLQDRALRASLGTSAHCAAKDFVSSSASYTERWLAGYFRQS